MDIRNLSSLVPSYLGAASERFTPHELFSTHHDTTFISKQAYEARLSSSCYGTHVSLLPSSHTSARPHSRDGPAPARVAPLHLCRQIASCETPGGGLARLAAATLLPDEDFCSASASAAAVNGLALLELAVARDARTAAPEPRCLAWQPFEGAVRAFTQVEEGPGRSPHLVVAAGNRLSLWRIKETAPGQHSDGKASSAAVAANNGMPGLVLSPVWDKPVQRQVRDMAYRGALLAWGGNDGRIHCADLARPEQLRHQYVSSEFYARSVYAPIGSVCWHAGDSASILSLTLDDGRLQTRDLRTP